VAFFVHRSEEGFSFLVIPELFVDGPIGHNGDVYENKYAEADPNDRPQPCDLVRTCFFLGWGGSTTVVSFVGNDVIILERVYGRAECRVDNDLEQRECRTNSVGLKRERR